MEAEDLAASEAIAAADREGARELGSAWMQHMRAGEFSRAWEVSDEVMRRRAGESCDHLPRHFQWVWKGAPLDGKHVLIRCYHGLGDTIQFIRFVPLVARIARRVTVWAQPQLRPLLESVPGIDLMISIDSMPAHLAAALGVPVWTLLQTPSDWRWMDKGDASRWYPNMRLFRQPRPGEWSSVVADVAHELARVASARDQLARKASINSGSASL